MVAVGCTAGRLQVLIRSRIDYASAAGMASNAVRKAPHRRGLPLGIGCVQGGRYSRQTTSFAECLRQLIGMT